MAQVILDALLSEYREALGPEDPEGEEILRFRRFLLLHGGLRKLEAPGGKAQIIDRPAALRCFHFSQHLDWYLAEKEGASRAAVERARAALDHFNQWLFERNHIPAEDFEENRESILGGAQGSPGDEDADAPGDPGGEASELLPGIPEEKDFYVPGEYAVLLSGDFVLTRVEEESLYAIREGDREETGPIRVGREIAASSRIGDPVHLSLGKAGDHWNLLSLTRRRTGPPNSSHGGGE
jgi:hypothetical protein